MSTIAGDRKSGRPPWLVYAALGAIALIAVNAAIPNLMRSRIGAEKAVHFSEQPARAHKLEANDAQSVSLPGRSLISAELKSRAPAAAPSAITDRTMVRTGELELTVQDPADSAEKIRLIGESMGGYLESAQIG